MSIKKELASIIEKSLLKMNLENKDIIIEIPSKKENGDYSSNIALMLTKILHKNPIEIAEEIKNNIEKGNILEEIMIKIYK